MTRQKAGNFKMHQNQSLADLDVKTAADLLAKRAATVRKVKAAGLFKKAGISDMIGQAGQYLGAHPHAQSALELGAAGAGIGGLGGLITGQQRRKDDPDAPSPFSSALTGALAGGAVGGGIGAAIPAAQHIAETPPAVQQMGWADNALKSMQPGSRDYITRAIAEGAKQLVSPFGATWTANEGQRALRGLSGAASNAKNIWDPNLLHRAVAGRGDAVSDAFRGQTPEFATAVMQALRHGKIDPQLLAKFPADVAAKLNVASLSRQFGTNTHGTVESLLGVNPGTLRPEFHAAAEELLRQGKLSDSTVGRAWTGGGPSPVSKDFRDWMATGTPGWHVGSMNPADLSKERDMLNQIMEKRTKGTISGLDGSLDDTISNFIHEGVAKNKAVPRAGFQWGRGLIPGMEQNKINLKPETGGWKSRLAVPVLGDLAYNGVNRLYNHMTGNPTFGLPEGTTPEMLAKLQQFAKSNPEWLAKAKEQGTYIPPQLQQ